MADLALALAASFRVLSDRSLFASVVAFAPGIPSFALRVKRQLACARRPAATAANAAVETRVPPEDVELWQHAVRATDTRTLEALHILSTSDTRTGERVRGVLTGIVSFALTTVRDTALLDWIESRGMFRFDEIGSAALFELGEQNNLRMLRWTVEHGRRIDYGAASGAASGGHLDVLRYLQSVGSERVVIDSTAVCSAAGCGHLRALEFLLQLDEWDLRRWATDAFSSAIERGQLHVVRYLHENGYKCRSRDIDKAVGNGHLDVVKFLHEHRIGSNSIGALDRAVEHGHLEVARFLRANGWTVRDHRVFAALAKHNRLDILQLLCESGVEFAVNTGLYTAVNHGNMDFVRYLDAVDPDCADYDQSFLTATAARRGYLDVIEYFHAHKSALFFDSRAMHYAAVNGHLDVVKFLHENRDEGCQSSTLKDAHEKGFHDVVDFLCAHRPPKFDRHLEAMARMSGHLDLADKIERGAAAARAAGRKLYAYRNV